MADKLDKTSKEEILQAGNPKEKDKGKFQKNSKFKKRKGGSHERRVNDPSWYVPNASLVKDVASLPFAVYNGVDYQRFHNSIISSMPSDPVVSTHIPGTMVYKYAPWYGTSTPTSALNLTMRALYSFVRHANAGKTNYEAPDLMLYIMAMDNVYLLIHEIKRILRLAYHYNLENRNIPERIFTVLDIDTQDLLGNLANYRAQLNTRISKANSLAVPANFNLFKRRAVLGSVVLTDEPNRPTQLIIPQSDGYYVYVAAGATGGKLVFTQVNKQWTNTNSTTDYQVTYSLRKKLSSYFELLDSMLTILLSDEDINIMSGDIIKAYGDNLFKLPFIEENEIQEITHDQNLLLQFSNSLVLDLPNATFDMTLDAASSAVNFVGSQQQYAYPVIDQQGGSILSMCKLEYARDYVGKDFSVLNQLPITNLYKFFLDTSESNSITPENTIEWSRLMMAAIPDSPNSKVFILEAGVEIGLGWLVGTPSKYFNLADVPTLYKEQDTFVSQFYQFAVTTGTGYAIKLPAPTDSIAKYTGDVSVWIRIQDNLKSKIANDTNYRNKNNWYTFKAISGLNYGPESYLVAGINRFKTNAYTTFFDGSVSKLYEKTALVDRENVRAMHDVALLGLISSPYITNNK